MNRFGFSWLGVIFIAIFFLPDIIWASKQAATRHAPQKETTLLMSIERLGQVLVCASAITCAPLQLEPWSTRSWLLVAAGAIAAAYLIWWSLVFRRRPNAAQSTGIPIPGIVFCASAFAFIGIYALDLLLLVCDALMIIGDIGVRREAKREAQRRQDEQSDPWQN